jgi:hypothetical protein
MYRPRCNVGYRCNVLEHFATFRNLVRCFLSLLSPIHARTQSHDTSAQNKRTNTHTHARTHACTLARLHALTHARSRCEWYQRHTQAMHGAAARLPTAPRRMAQRRHAARNNTPRLQGCIRPHYTTHHGPCSAQLAAYVLAGNFTLTLGQHSQGADGVAADKRAGAGATEVSLPARMLRHICARTALGAPRSAPVMYFIFRYRYV